jgi:TonB family protein
MMRRFRYLERPGRFAEMKLHHVAIGLGLVLVLVTSFFPLSPEAIAVTGDREADASEVTLAKPTLIHTVQPVYPKDAKKAGVGGVVLLELEVKKDGTVGTVKELKGIEGYPSLTESAIEAVRQWKFTPATREGVPEAVSFAVTIKFQLETDEKK